MSGSDLLAAFEHFFPQRASYKLGKLRDSFMAQFLSDLVPRAKVMVCLQPYRHDALPGEQVRNHRGGPFCCTVTYCLSLY